MRIVVRCTAEEKQRAIAQAAVWGLTLTDYIKMLLSLKEPQVKTADAQWADLYRQTSELGAKLNEMSRAVEQQSSSTDLMSSFEEVRQRLRQLQKGIAQIRLRSRE